MVETQEEEYIQERKWRREPAKLGQPREHGKSDREGMGLTEHAITDSLS